MGKQTLQLITEIEIEMEQGWQDQSFGLTPNADCIYENAAILEEQGIGAILIPNMQGNLRWFDLETMSF